MVRTSSGDWAEACAQEAQRLQDAEKQEANDNNPQASSAATFHTRSRSCFSSTMCLGDDGTYEPFVDAGGGVSNQAAEVPPIQLYCCLPDEAMSQQLQQLLENHVPQQALRSIR